MQSLQDRHALVTGGGTGIGRAIALMLAQNGAKVTITGRRKGPLQEVSALHANIACQIMDVTDEASVTKATQAARDIHGPITIAVANAGIAEGRSLAKTDLEFWRQIMATNLDGAFLTFRACEADMLEQGWGRGIAISSIAGLKGLKGAAAYTASKHGLTGLIRGLAADNLHKPLTYNAICPAYVDTDIVPSNLKRIMERTGLPEDKAMAIMRDANPHGDLIDPVDIAAAALYLCGPHSGTINGQALQIAGGEF